MPPKRKARSTLARPVEVKRERRSEEALESVVRIDPDGDLLLAIEPSLPDRNKEPSVFLVDRKILSLSSPVFRAMLAPPDQHLQAISPFPTVFFTRENFVNGNLEGVRDLRNDLPKITIEMDNVEALVIILHVVHLQGHRVPDKLTSQLLLDLAFLCDQYHMRRSLATWSRTWAKPWIMQSDDINKDLFITYAFKLDREFREVTREIIIHSEPDAGLTPLKVKGCSIDGFITAKVMNEIISCRRETIETLEKILWGLQKTAQDPSIACRYINRWTPQGRMSAGHQQALHNDPDFCRTVQLGLYRKHLPYLERPHDRSPFRKQSLSRILEALARLNVDRPEYLGRHKMCLQGNDMYNFAHGEIGKIGGLNLDESWYPDHSQP